MLDTPFSLKDLKQDPRNARKHGTRNISTIVDSLHEVGAARSGVIDEHGMILAGNGTYDALKQAGIDKVKVVEADGNEWVVVQRKGLTKEQKVKLALADNRSADLAEWDLDILKELSQEVDLSGLWNAEELSAVLAEANGTGSAVEDVEPQIDKAEELREKWSVQSGQLWSLGEHRLLCGDSTKREDVERVMGGEKAALCFTSPPYAQQRNYTAESKEKLWDWDRLMQGVFENLPMSDDGQVLVNLGLIHRDGEWVPYWESWIEWMRSQGWRRFGWYVWDQGHGMRCDYHGRCAPSHEFLFHFNKSSAKAIKWIESKHAGERGGENRSKDGIVPQWTGDLIQDHKIPDSVWRIERQKGGIEGHPAPFSVGLVKFAIETWPSEVLYEPFSGSGTTILACEQLGRKARAIEISPGYVAVALERYFQATQKEPKPL